MATDGERKGKAMAASFSVDERREHFAFCVQLFGGTTAFSRRLGIDERAIRRFINGERPLGDGLLEDTAKALRLLIDEATAAEAQIAATLRFPPTAPS
jgi:hypothetical protein